jgi:hypothetical protein
MLFGLAMELVVTPLICLWQSRIAAHDACERVSRTVDIQAAAPPPD